MLRFGGRLRQDGPVATPDARPDEHEEASGAPRFPPALMHSAAVLYYLENATQAEIAQRLGTSRPTVSRLLSEARREGIVRIEVIAPVDRDLDELARRLSEALGLERVHLSALPTRGPTGAALAPALSSALRSIGLVPGDVVLVSSGRTVYEAAQAELPPLPGITVAPMIGGQDEPEVWYAPNEIARQVAVKVGGTPSFLYAPALPGAELYETLLADPSIRRVIELWGRARCAILGIGAPPLTRTSLPRFIANDTGTLRDAVGDVCSRFYDADGRPVPFPGVERLMATSLESLKAIPFCIGLAAGLEKVPSILTGARAGYFGQLVTDAETAAGLLEAAERMPASRRTDAA
jgi:DNA-binding transcriptional regulator LsrR (DeoR family)